MTVLQFHMLAIPVLYAPFVLSLYALIALHRKVRIKNYKTWKNASITSEILPDEFIQRAQNICLSRGYYLVDIIKSDSSLKVVMKEFPSYLWVFGQFYCIEYNYDNKVNICIYVRGGVLKNSINNGSFRHTQNMFVKL